MSDSLELKKRLLRFLNSAKQQGENEKEQEEEVEKYTILFALVDDIKEEFRASQKAQEGIVKAITELKIASPEVKVPEVIVPPITIPPINVPEAKVTVDIPPIKVPTPEVTVNVPEIKIPEITVPEPKVSVTVPPVEMPESMTVTGIVDVNDTRPLRMTPVDFDGKPVTFGGGGGGGPREVKATLNAGKNVIGKVETDTPRAAFGEELTAELTPIFQYSFEYTTDNAELFTTTVVSGGTVTQSSGMGVVGTSTTTGSSALLVSKKAAKYRAGQGGNFRFTAKYTDGVAGTKQLAGLADEAGSSQAFKNGYMIGYEGTTFGVHRYYDDNIETIALADCDDPLDGTGASGMTIDQTKLNVFQINFQYLGAGKIQFFIESQKTGDFVKFHTIQYANQKTVPSVYMPNFSATFYTENGSTTSNMQLSTASCAYFVEGRTNLLMTHQPIFATGAVATTLSAGTQSAVLTIKNQSSYAGKTNFIEALVQGITIAIDATAASNICSVRLIKNTTLGGSPEYNDINTTNSIMEKDVYGTTVTGGFEFLDTLLAGQRDAQFIDLSQWNYLLEPNDTLTIAMTSTGGADVQAAIVWKELF